MEILSRGKSSSSSMATLSHNFYIYHCMYLGVQSANLVPVYIIFQNRKKAYEDWYLPDYKLPNGESFVAPDPSKHKIFEYTTKTDGRKIFVFDNLFPKELLDHLRSFVLKYGSYFYDDSIDSDSDNVQWIAGFLLKPYLLSPYWKVVKKVCIIFQKLWRSIAIFCERHIIQKKTKTQLIRSGSLMSSKYLFPNGSMYSKMD